MKDTESDYPMILSRVATLAYVANDKNWDSKSLSDMKWLPRLVSGLRLNLNLFYSMPRGHEHKHPVHTRYEVLLTSLSSMSGR